MKNTVKALATTAVAIGALLVTPGAGFAGAETAAPAEPAAPRVIEVQGVETDMSATDMSAAGTDIKDCYYYNGRYLGCSYFDADPDPELFTVCDEFADGRYVKGRIKFGGNVYQLTVAGAGKCVYWAPNIAEGTHLGIHTGVEGLGWTAYEYGYA